MDANPPKSEIAVAEPVPPRPKELFFQRIDWLSFVIAFFVTFLIYTFTANPDVDLENSGIFVTGAMYPGVAHPPGYPPFTLWAWIFIKLLPIGSIGWRATIATGTAAALACGIVALMVSRMAATILKEVPNKLKPHEQAWLRVICGYAAGTIFGLNGAFWPRAIVPGPWSLSIFLLCLVLCILMRWHFEPDRKRWLYAAAFVYGLLLTNSQIHLAFMPAIPFLVVTAEKKIGRDFFLSGFVLFLYWATGSLCGVLPSISVYGPGFIVIFIALGILAGLIGTVLAVRTRRIFSEWRAVLLGSGFCLAGLCFYLYLPVASITVPPMDWGHPRTVEGFFHVITRGQYVSMYLTDNFFLFSRQMVTCFLAAGKDFGWPYLVVAAVPFAFFRRLPVEPRRWILASVPSFIFLMILISMVMGPYWGAKGQLDSPVGPYDVRSFLTAAYVILALWTGYGLVILGILLTKPSGSRHPAAA